MTARTVHGQRCICHSCAHVARFYVKRRANIVFGSTDDRAEAERLLDAARRQHPRDRVRIIEVQS